MFPIHSLRRQRTAAFKTETNYVTLTNAKLFIPQNISFNKNEGEGGKGNFNEDKFSERKIDVLGLDKFDLKGKFRNGWRRF